MCLTPEKCLGGRAWPNIVPGDERHEIPLLLWCNSTLGLLMHWWKGTRQQMGRSNMTITAIPDLPVLDPRTLTQEQIGENYSPPSAARHEHPEGHERSTLGLDLYLWLTYRTFALKRPLRLSWPRLYRQFGSNPAKANDTRTVDNFRTDCLRELKKIKDAWPDLHYQTVKGALLLSPSPPRIPPAQLRLVE